MATFLGTYWRGKSVSFPAHRAAGRVWTGGCHSAVDDVGRRERPETAPMRSFSGHQYKQSLKDRRRPKGEVQNFSLDDRNVL